MTLVKSLVFLHKMVGFHSGLYKTGMVTWNIYKRKNICGMYESKGKAVAFHVMKPCIGFIQGFFCMNGLKIGGE